MKTKKPRNPDHVRPRGQPGPGDKVIAGQLANLITPLLYNQMNLYRQLNLRSLVKDMKFTLEIDVTSEEGLPRETLENKIKETIRQIRARIREERLK